MERKRGMHESYKYCGMRLGGGGASFQRENAGKKGAGGIRNTCFALDSDSRLPLIGNLDSPTRRILSSSIRSPRIFISAAAALLYGELVI